MHIGSDFFKWMNFIIRLVRIFIEIFGDEEEKTTAKNNNLEA